MKKAFLILSMVFGMLVMASVAMAVEKKAVGHAPVVVKEYTHSSSTNFEHEISTAFTGGAYTSAKVGTTTVSTLAAQASWVKFIRPKIQAGGEAAFTSMSGGALSTSFFDVMGVVNYNLEDNTRESIYVKGGLGLFAVPNTTGTGYDSKFGFMAGAGKRFPLWERIQYSPEIRLVKKGDLDVAFNIYFINLSIMY